jgi:hypothetical protein
VLPLLSLLWRTVFVFLESRVRRAKEVLEKAARLRPGSLGLILLVPEELSLRYLTGRLGYCQNDRYDKPPCTHFTQHIGWADNI